MSHISFDKEKCTACGICSTICPAGIICSEKKGIHPSLLNMKPYATAVGTAKLSILECNCSKLSGVSPSRCYNKHWTDQTRYSHKYIQIRRSIRAFKNKSVEKEKIEGIFEAVRFAPSAMNAQPVKWLVVNDPAEIKKFANLTIDWMRLMDGTGADHP